MSCHEYAPSGGCRQTKSHIHGNSPMHVEGDDLTF